MDFEVSGFSVQVSGTTFPGRYMKLPQNGTASFPIRLAAFQANGWADT